MIPFPLEIARRFAVALLIGLCLLSRDSLAETPTADPAPFALTSVDLYQPEAVLQQRLGSDAAPLADYVKRLDARARETLAPEPAHHGITGTLVVAVKPGAGSRVWIVLGHNVLPVPLRQKLVKALESVTPVEVQGGPVAFAMNFEAWGGGTPVLEPGETVAIPDAWKAAMRGMPPGVIPDAPLQAVWP